MTSQKSSGAVAGAARRLIPELRRLVGQYIAEALRER